MSSPFFIAVDRVRTPAGVTFAMLPPQAGKPAPTLLLFAMAGADTHYHYPMPPEHPLWRMPNVIMTPHISGSSGSPFFLRRVWDIFVQNVERLLKEETLLNELTPAQLAGN